MGSGVRTARALLAVSLAVGCAIVAAAEAPVASAAPRTSELTRLLREITRAPTPAVAHGTRDDGSASYTDAVGDNSLAPDIGDMTVSQRGSLLVFELGIANLGPGLVAGEFVGVLVDVDRNPTTGCDGSEVALAVLGDTAPNPDYAALARCMGDWTFFVPQGSFGYTYVPGTGIYGPGVITLQAGTEDVGVTTFDFTVNTSYDSTDFDAAGPFRFGSDTAPPPPPPPPPPFECVVPRLAGRPLAAARTAIHRANCSVGRLHRAFSPRRAGTVIAQAPRAGTRRADGARVDLTVSRGPRRR